MLQEQPDYEERKAAGLIGEPDVYVEPGVPVPEPEPETDEADEANG